MTVYHFAATAEWCLTLAAEVVVSCYPLAAAASDPICVWTIVHVCISATWRTAISVATLFTDEVSSTEVSVAFLARSSLPDVFLHLLVAILFVILFAPTAECCLAHAANVVVWCYPLAPDAWTNIVCEWTMIPVCSSATWRSAISVATETDEVSSPEVSVAFLARSSLPDVFLHLLYLF